MKLISVKSTGVDNGWNTLDVTVEVDGKQYSGKLLFEIDGRDAEIEGDLLKLEEVGDGFWNQFWDMGNEAVKKIEDELAKGDPASEA